MLFQAPGVVLARLGLETLAWMITLTTLVVMLAPSMIDVLSNIDDLARAWTLIHAQWSSQLWLVPGSMLMACAVALHLGLGAWGDALVWVQATHDTSSSHDAGEVFARALSWRTLRALLRLGLGMLAMMVYIGLLKLGMMSQGVGTIALSGILYALGLTTLLWLNLAIEHAGARHVTTHESLGESLVEACGLCAQKLYAAYKLIIMSATVSAPAGIASILLNIWAPSSLWGSVATLSGQALLFVSMSLSVTLFRAASIHWIVAQHADQTKSDAAPAQIERKLDALRSFLPESFAHVVPLTQVLSRPHVAIEEE